MKIDYNTSWNELESYLTNNDYIHHIGEHRNHRFYKDGILIFSSEKDGKIEFCNMYFIIKLNNLYSFINLMNSYSTACIDEDELLFIFRCDIREGFESVIDEVSKFGDIQKESIQEIVKNISE